MFVRASKLSIKQTSIILVIFGLIISSVVISIGINTSAHVDDLVSDVSRYTETTAIKRDLLSQMESALGYGGAIHRFKNYVLRGSEKYIRGFEKKANTALTAIENYRELGITQEESTNLDAIQAVIRKYLAQGEVIERMTNEGNTPKQIDAVVKISDKPALDAFSALRQKLIAARKAYKDDLAAELGTLQKITALESFATPVALFMLTGLMLLALLKTRKVIGGEPQEVERLSRRVAEGDLRVADDYSQHQPEGILGSTLTSVETVSNVVNQTKDIADLVSHSVGEISFRVRELRERFKKQQSNIQSTANTMKQMTAITHKNAESAVLANGLSEEANKSSVRGSEVVRKAIDAMDEINTSSQHISDIITVIDEIAFQTNLLALNAAVEAARAGDHGKGFAVVASEVRNLAQRSAEAAKQIEGLIEDSTRKVNDGTVLVNAAGDALKDIFHSVEKVSDVVSEMASSNKQQSSGIDEVNASIGNIEAVRATNERQVGDIDDDCALLDRQANELLATIAFFKTNGHSESNQHPPSLQDPDEALQSFGEDWSIPAVSQEYEPETQWEAENAERGDWDGAERRSGSRPWSDRSVAANTSKS
ncbi:MAG TPA: hypothetical protein ENJ35_07700, partial [Gammaproteobacteria bacterium]|nr:hypothetical protein [Gammaproteobacteria bacterium]